MVLLRTVLAIALMMVASISQAADAGNMPETTKATFGDVNPAVPNDWTKRIGRNGVVIFECMEKTCINRGEIAYSAMVLSSDIEAELRRAKASGTSLRDMGNALSSSVGNMKQIGFKDYTDSKQVRFERVYLVNNDKDVIYYIMHRSVQGTMSRIVSARAPTLAKAKKYLKIALKEFN